MVESHIMLYRRFYLEIPMIKKFVRASPSPLSYSTFSWNTRIISLTDSNDHVSSVSSYKLMLHPPNPKPDSFTFPAILRSSTSLSSLPLTCQLHSHIIKLNYLLNKYVLTSLITSYSRLGALPSARQVLSELIIFPLATIETIVVGYNSLISGCSRDSSSKLQSFLLFKDMIMEKLPFNTVTLLALLPCLPSSSNYSMHAFLTKAGFTSNVPVLNCLVSCYSKFGVVDYARKVFDEINEEGKDIVSYNAMISCYSQNGLGSKVVELYHELKRSGQLRPDPVTFVGVLSACANLGAHALGREIDADINKDELFKSNIYLKNALINMHARCGDLKKASEIFNAMKERTLVTWTAIIAGYGMHGLGNKTVEKFEQMLASGVRPDGVVLVSLLSACSHSGLTNTGLDYFDKFEKEYNIKPGPEHYACVIDLLGRAGRLNEAHDLIKSMKVEADGGIWGALLGACKIHRNVELGKIAFNHLVEIEPTNVGYYVLLTNIYQEAGKLKEMADIRALMKKRGLKKEPGCSYVELKGKVHLFMADDHSHKISKEIYETIDRLEGLVDGSRREKGPSNGVGYHSEKLAVAFGLLSTDAGVEIVVIKNLRVCENCHCFMKMVSKVVSRRLVIRDATRFHHFENGLCSCNDYW